MPNVTVLENEMSQEARNSFSGTIKLLAARYDTVRVEEIWLVPDRFSDRKKEWRARIILNGVRTQWRWSETKKRWRRTN